MTKDMGSHLQMIVRTDASACEDIIQRQDLGKIKHMKITRL